MYVTGISQDGGTIGKQINVNVSSMADAVVTLTTLKQDMSVKDNANEEIHVGEKKFLSFHIECNE